MSVSTYRIRLRRTALTVLGLFVLAGLYQSAFGQINLEGRSGEIRRENINLLVNQERTLSIKVTRISVANPEIARVTELGGEAGVLVTGLKDGATELRLWPMDRPEQVYVYTVNVTARDIDEMQQEIEALLGSMLGVEVRKVGNRLVIDGTVLTKGDRDRIDVIKKEYVILDLSEDRFSEVEQKELEQRQEKEEQAILEAVKRDLREQKLMSDGDAEGPNLVVEMRTVRGVRKLYITGTVFGDEHLTKVQTIAGVYYPSEDIIYVITVENPVVEIEMQLAAVNQTRAKEVGDNNLWNSFMQAAIDAVVYDSESNEWTNPTFTIGEGANTALRLLNTEGATYAYIQQAQAVKSGSEAKFQDGGEMYFTTVGENPSLQAVEFGFQANVTPILYEDGSCLVTVHVINSFPVQQTSGVDDEAAVSLEKIEQSTQIEANVNQSIVLTGIDQNQAGLVKSETPFLGKVPILNLFFKQTGRQRANSRDVMVLTPTAPKYFAKNVPDVTRDVDQDLTMSRAETGADDEFQSIQADQNPWWKFWKWHND